MTFVETQFVNKQFVNKLFVNRFGTTDEISVKGSRHKFSNLDGNDLKMSAESALKERL